MIFNCTQNKKNPLEKKTQRTNFVINESYLNKTPRELRSLM